MSKFITNITNFRAGVLSEKLKGRADIREYENSLSVGKNALISKQGGAYKRFGLETVTELAGSGEIQLETMHLFNNHTVSVVFSGGYFYIYNTKGVLLKPSTFISGTAGKFTLATYESFVVIVDGTGEFRPTVLEFGLDSNDELEIVNETVFDSSFFSKPNKTNYRASHKVRVKQLVNFGAARIIESQGFDLDDVLELGDVITVAGLSHINENKKFNTNVYEITSRISATEYNATSLGYHTTTGAAITGGTINFDSFTYVGYEPDARYFAPLIRYGAGGYTQESEWYSEWSVPVWGDLRGWPTSVSVDEGRLIMGAAPQAPATFWASGTNNPFFFLQHRTYNPAVSFTAQSVSGATSTAVLVEGVRLTNDLGYDGDIQETDAYTFTVASDRGSEITMMESSVNFIIGGTHREFVVTGNGAALSAKNVSVRPHTSHGSAKNLSTSVDNVVIYVSRNKKNIFLFRYNEENGSFISKEITILNPDLLENDTVTSLDWHEGLGILFVTTDNKKLLTTTIDNTTDTVAFTHHEIYGDVEDCGYVIDGDEEYMSVILSRGGRFYLQKISAFTRPVDYLTDFVDNISYLDSAIFLSQSSVPTTITRTVKSVMTTHEFAIDPSSFVAGDAIVFNSTNSSDFDGINVALNTNYFVIPVRLTDIFGNRVGIRLATSVANAQAGTFIDLGLAPYSQIFAGVVTYQTSRTFPSTIPTGGYPAGVELTVFSKSASSAGVEFTVVTDGNEILDTGVNGEEQVVGQTYEFHIATSPLEAGQQWGSAQLGMKRVDRAGIRFYNTRSFKLSTDGYNSEEILFDEPTTGRKELEVTGSPEIDHSIHIQNDKAEGCYISSLVLRGLSNDG